MNPAPDHDLRVTLLVPTMNRSGFLARLLQYYAENGFRGRIAIGDSSNAEHVRSAREAIHGMQGRLDIVYEEYPRTTVGECLQKLVALANTPFAATLPDDDFLVPEALDECTRFLVDHPDYSAAHGVGVGLSLDSNGLHGQVTECDYYHQPIIEAETASERLDAHLNDYRVSLFSVHRIEAWRAMLRDVHRQQDTSFAAELLPCCLTVVLGKVKQLDCFYVVRQNHNLRYELPDAYDWVTSEVWQPSFKVFSDGLAEAVAAKDGIPMDAAREVVKAAFKQYLVLCLGVKRRWSGPPWTLTMARQAKRLVNTLKPKGQSEFELAALLQSSSRHHAAFMPVYRSLVGASEAAGGEKKRA